jgi:hypothetical protein
MEAVSTSEASLNFFQITRRINPENSNLQTTWQLFATSKSKDLFPFQTFFAERKNYADYSENISTQLSQNNFLELACLVVQSQKIFVFIYRIQPFSTSLNLTQYAGP